MQDAARTDNVTDEVVGEIAKLADVDARSVVRRLAGLPVRGRVGARIDRVIAERLSDDAGRRSE